MRPGWITLLVLSLCGPLSVPAQAATVRVTIDKLVYVPAEITVKAGDSIEWVNKDMLAHTATATNKDWNVVIGPNKTATLVLNKPGTVDYFCIYHPNMKGKVSVTP